MFWTLGATFYDRLRVRRGGDPLDEFAPAHMAGIAIGFLAGIVMLVAMIFWLIWVYRTYRNLPALGAHGLLATPGWAVGYYFIPIVHLFRPFQVMREAWRASDPHYPGGTAWRERPVAPTVNAWWALYVASILLAIVSVVFEIQDEDPRALLTAAGIDPRHGGAGPRDRVPRDCAREGPDRDAGATRPRGRRDGGVRQRPAAERLRRDACGAADATRTRRVGSCETEKPRVRGTRGFLASVGAAGSGHLMNSISRYVGSGQRSSLTMHSSLSAAARRLFSAGNTCSRMWRAWT
jgi:hypothetical protein